MTSGLNPRKFLNVATLAVVTAFTLYSGVLPATSAQVTAPIATAKPAPSGVSNNPTSTSASFGDWVLNCQELLIGAQTQHVCEVVQQMRPRDQHNPIAALAIGRLPSTKPLVLTVVLPASISFQSTPILSGAGSQAAQLVLGWRKCVPGGCFADSVLTDEMLTTWKAKSGAGRLTWRDSDGRDLAIAVSTRGLAQALDALDKED